MGFAAGIERFLLVMSKKGINPPASSSPTLFLAALDPASRRWVFNKAMQLRAAGIPIEIDYLDRSVKAQMREANRQQSRYVLVVGERELETGKAQLKNMKNGKEVPVALDNLASVLQSHEKEEES